MQDFAGKVAVVTGGASGIGFALCERAAAEGMKVVLADIEEKVLAEAAAKLEAAGAATLSVRVDVSSFDDVQALADKAVAAFGSVDLAFNNAGVATYLTTPIWENTIDTWKWIIGVNLWGVIHGMRVFTPLMLEQEGGGHMVNTASSVAFVSSPAVGVYKATKHAVASISETLYHELGVRGSNVKVSVLAPEMVMTGLRQSRRNAPAGFDEGVTEKTEAEQAIEARTGQMPKMTPTEVADQVFDAIREERFYILPGWGGVVSGAEQRLADIKAGSPKLLTSLGDR